MKKRVTLKDIADNCGFTVNAVSRALRGDEKISEKTRKIITEEADRLGYIRNSMASSLRSGQSFVIAVIVENDKNLYYNKLVSDIHKILRKHGYVIMLLYSHGSVETEQQLLRIAVSYNADGILLFPCSEQEDNRLLKSIMQKVPLLLVHREIKNLEANVVRLDDFSGGFQAAEHLVKNGHKRFLYLAGPEHNYSEIRRSEGFRSGLKKNGIELHQVQRIRYEEILECIETGNFDLLMKYDYNAIFSFNDDIAYHVLCSLQKKGILFPDNISLVGWDCIQKAFPFLPVISSVSDYPDGSMAGKVAEKILRMINETDLENNENEEIVVPVEIYHKEATVARITEKTE